MLTTLESFPFCHQVTLRGVTNTIKKVILHSTLVWPSEGVKRVPQTVPRSRKLREGKVRWYVRWVGSDLSANDGETLLVRELRRDTWLKFS
jgi:hypothetical protein